MKIAIISLHHLESSLCLAKYLAKRGHDIDYYFMGGWLSRYSSPGVVIHNQKRHVGIYSLTNEEIPELIQYTEGLSVRYYFLNLFHFRPLFHLLNKLFLKIAAKKIKAKHYNAIDIVGQSYGIGLLHNTLKGENITHTLHEIGSHHESRIQDAFVESIICNSSKVILHSKSLQDKLKLIDVNNMTKSTVIPFGMFETTLLYEEEVELPFEIPNKNVTLLFYGYISPYKGVDILEEACRIMNDKEIKYNIIIAGSGYNPSIDYFCNMPNAFVINRFLSSNEIIKLHRISDVVVMPYKSASQSGIIPTSFLLGCPVIGTRVGAIPEVLSDNYNGLLCEPNNPTALADTIEQYISNSDLRAKLKSGVQTFGKGDRYDWNIIAEQTEEFIR